MGNYVNSHLIMGETVVYSAKLHWIIYLTAKAILTLWIAPFIQRATSEFAITTKRVIIKEGLIARRTLEMNLSKIETVNVDQNLRNTRPQLYWLDIATDPKRLREIEHESFGKFWQTVRDQDQIPLDFRHEGLESRLDLLRDINQNKKTYGGAGWANYAATYFNDTYLKNSVALFTTSLRTVII